MKLYLKILIHSIFWLVYFLLSTVLSISEKPEGWPLIRELEPHFFINFIWASIVFYMFYLYFIRLFESRKFVLYLFYSILVSIGITFLFMPVHNLFVEFEILDYRVFLPPIAGTFILAQCGSLVRGFENWFSNIALKTELENRNLRNELELLKSQINPHFLFNTLNNIDSLIQTAPNAASSSLITLSDMLRYMIYDTKPEKVPLEKEIMYLKNYISLQQLRFRSKEYVKATFPDQCNGVLVAPMLFIPFIENAFKYSSDRGEQPVIDISLHCNKSNIKFIVRNYFGDETSKSSQNRGVGLSNVKRRLELLYADIYSLDISSENHIFRIELTIKLQ